MTWVRIDDKFPSHPKISQLTDREFRVHIRVLCYCGEYATNGALGVGIWNEIPGLSKPMGRKFVKLGLWDETASGLAVHDFEQYNAATLEERVRAYLFTNPDATGNQVHKALGGRRETLLDVVAKLKNQFRGGTTPGSIAGSTEPLLVVPELVLAPAPTPEPLRESLANTENLPTHLSNEDQQPEGWQNENGQPETAYANVLSDITEALREFEMPPANEFGEDDPAPTRAADDIPF